MQPIESRIISIDPCRDARWDALVSRNPTSVFQSASWLRVLSGTYGFPLRARLLVDTDGGPEAGIAFAEIDDFMDGRITSLPFSDYCDPVVADLPTWQGLIQDLMERERRIDLRCLDNEVPQRDERFAVVGQAGWHGVDLERPLDDIWNGLHSSARRAIRKADSAGVTIKVASSEADLRTFFELHLRIRKYKYRLLAQPFRFFERIWEEFLEPEAGFLLLGMLDDKPIGSILFLEWQNTLYYKFNASEASSLPARPNDRLIWEGIKMGKERGLRVLDFGLSDLDQEGLVRYKRKYATAEKSITLLRHTPPGLPSESDVSARRVLRRITELMVEDDVPDDVTARAGDLLYRYFT